MLRIDRQISGGNLNQFISKKLRTKGIPNHYLMKVKKFQNLDIIERVDDSTPLIVVTGQLIGSDINEYRIKVKKIKQ